jgi:hypothetical protein
MLDTLSHIVKFDVLNAVTVKMNPCCGMRADVGEEPAVPICGRFVCPDVGNGRFL